jgi:O-antigen/teichoic acid export membrane protein
MNRRRYLTNVFSNWVQIAWVMAWGIVMVPIYLSHLGKTDYGIWLLINSMVGYYGLLDFGVHNAVVRHVARFLGLDDPESLNEVFNTAFVVQTVMGLAAMIACLLVALVLPHVHGFAAAEHPQAGTLLLLVGLSSALAFPGSVFRGTLVAAERFDLSNLTRIALSLMINVGQIVVLQQGGGLVAMAWVLLGATVLEKPVSIMLALHAVPHLRISLRRFRWQRVGEVFSYGWHASLTAAGERLRFFTDSVVIGAFLPAQAIADFRVGSRPLHFLTHFVRGISRVLTPAFSRTEAAEQGRRMPRLLVLGTRATALLAVLGCLVLAVAGGRLIRLWLGEGFDESVTILLVLLPAYLLETALAPTGSVLLGTRQFKVMSRWAIIEGVGNLAMSLALIRPLGLIGVALGTAIPMVVVRLFVLPYYAARGAGMGFGRLMAEVWSPVLLPLAGAGTLSIGLVRWIPGSDLLSVALLVGSIVTTYGGLALLGLWLRRDELLPRYLLRASTGKP